MKRRTEITIETERILLINRRAGSSRPRCPVCAQAAGMVPEGEAAALLGVTIEELRRAAVAVGAHTLVEGGGRLLLCLESLLSPEAEGRTVEMRTDDGRTYQP
ncbi:MAG TPA: hypothetical protein VD968_10870 [Pyrinomonadaceae bacterium]|nr:hypothetical protein [Pyrinomonadaceae bacterium]